MKQRIILVDDDADDRELFADAIYSLKLPSELFLFQSGQELFDQLDQMDRSISTFIFLDLNMPILSGLEILERLRHFLGIDTFFVTIYSTSSSERDIESAYAKGAHGYLSKPSNFARLTALITKTLSLATRGKMSPLPKEIFFLNK